MNQHIAMPHISVESPVAHNSWEDGKYITYDIIVNCEGDSCPLFALPRSLVSRRYREFRWLRKRLCAVASATVRRVPALPTVGCPVFDDRFCPEFIENRRRGLEGFLQGVCAIPTLLSEAALHLFLQTDLSIAEIDAYVDRKWGRREEVCDVILTLNRQKKCEERDEIASIASVGRWSEASLLDSEEDVLSNNESMVSSLPKGSTGSDSVNTAPTGSDPSLAVAQASADAQVVSPVLGLYLPPDNSGGESSGTKPLPIRSRPAHAAGASSVPSSIDKNHRRRSKSVQIRIANNCSASESSSLSPRSYNQRHQLSSSMSPSNGGHGDGDRAVPTSVDIYNRRRSAKSPAPTAVAGRSTPYYCSNAVWLSSAAGNAPRPRTLSPAAFQSTPYGSSQAASSLSPPSSIGSSSLSNGRA